MVYIYNHIGLQIRHGRGEKNASPHSLALPGRILCEPETYSLGELHEFFCTLGHALGLLIVKCLAPDASSPACRHALVKAAFHEIIVHLQAVRHLFVLQMLKKLRLLVVWHLVERV